MYEQDEEPFFVFTQSRMVENYDDMDAVCKYAQNNNNVLTVSNYQELEKFRFNLKQVKDESRYIGEEICIPYLTANKII